MKEISFQTKMFIGDNALDSLKRFSCEKVFIVTDPYIEQSGMLAEVTTRLDHGDNSYQIFSNIVPDPPIETVAEGVRSFKSLMLMS